MSSNWHTAGNWSPAVVPDSATDVVIPVASNPIQIISGSVAVRSLFVGSELLVYDDLTLTVASAVLEAPIRLRGNSTLSGGPYTINAGGSLIPFAGCNFSRLSNVVINGDLRLNRFCLRWNNVTVTGGVFVAGNGPLGDGGLLAFEGDQLLTCSITLANNASLTFEQATPGTLTIAPGVTIRGGTTRFRSQCYNETTRLINNGTILSDTPGGVFTIEVESFVNTGTLTAVSPARMDIRCPINPIGGTFQGTGLRFYGMLDLAGGTWDLAGGVYNIYGPGLRNGNVQFANGLLVFRGTCPYPMVSDINFSGNFFLGSSNLLWSNCTLSGIMTTNGAGPNSLTFVGDDVLNFSIINAPSAELVIARATPGVLTIAPNVVIRGGGIRFEPTCNGAPFSIANSGTITADVENSSIEFTATTFTNTGVVSANPGYLRIFGDVVNHGTFDSSQGDLRVTGSTNPTLGTFLGNRFAFDAIDLGGASWDLLLGGMAVGTIQNGTVNVLGGVLRPTRVSNAVINGDIRLATAGMRWNNSTLNGTLRVMGYVQGALDFEGNQTLSFPVIVDSTSNGVVIRTVGPGSLTISPTGMVRGGDIVFRSAVFGDAMNLINNGSILSEIAGRTITLSTASCTNTGLISASPGAVTVAGAITSTGSIVASAATLTLAGPVTNYSAPTGTLSGGTWRVEGGGRMLLSNPIDTAFRTIAPGTVVSVSDAGSAIVNDYNDSVLAGLTNLGGQLRLARRTITTTPGGGVFDNTGSLVLDAARLNVSGGYTQSASAALSLGVSGPAASQYGRLTVTGAASLAGTLTARPIGGYLPPAGAVFNAVSAAAVSGAFDPVLGGDGYTPLVTYAPGLASFSFASCPTLMTSPVDAVACPLGTASFQVLASGTPPVTYLWQVETPTGWQALSDTLVPGVGAVTGSIAASLSIGQPQASGLRVRVLVTNSCGAVTSDPAAVTYAPRCSLADIVGTSNPPAECGDGTVDGSDFIAFINSFSVGDPIVDPLADIAGGGPSGLLPDGIVDGVDFIAFINAFVAGC